MKKLLLSICIVIFTSLLHSQPISGGLMAHPTCFSENNGHIDVWVNGTPPFSFNWSNGSTSQNLTNLSAGIYYVTITDTSGNTYLDSAIVTENPPISVNITENNQFCNGALCGGAVNANATGGTAPYSYDWPGWSYIISNTHNPFIWGICDGVYDVEVTDALGCIAMASTTISNCGVWPTIDVSSIIENIDCSHSTGIIKFNISNGIPPYSIAFNGNQPSNIDSFGNLPAGSYSVVINDASGNCPGVGLNFIIGDSRPFKPEIDSVKSSTCDSTNNGAIYISVIGNGTYTYAWSNGMTTQDVTHLTSGNYTVTISDGISCTTTLNQYVGQTSLTFQIQTDSIKNITCTNQKYGSIYLSIIGTSGPYTYLWSNGKTTSSIDSLLAGQYTVTVSDSLGCQAINNYSITQNIHSVHSSYTSTDANCGNNGTASIFTYGALPPITYYWNTAPVQTSQTAKGLTPGTYTYTFTDSTGCQSGGTATINNTCTNIFYGKFFIDSNANCILDSNENYTYPTGQIVCSNGNQTIYNNINTDSSYYVRIPAGQWNYTYAKNLFYSSCSELSSCQSNTIFFPSPSGDSIHRDIPVLPSLAIIDLGVHPGWTSSNPGFPARFWILPWNYSNSTINATAVMRYDPRLIFNSCTPPCVRDSINSTLTWALNNFAPSNGLSWSNQVIGNFTVPTNLTIGDSLDNSYAIYPFTGDCDTSNNFEHDIRPITSSQDPNFKLAEPGAHLLPSDSIIKYTIHFQNTGNDTTTFIVLKDTLSPYLDPSSVRLLASSHPYQFTMKGEREMIWLFNPIFLPDSTTNPIESQGFVQYSVKVKPNLPISTAINNTAAIFFDFNSPIFTNTTNNIVANPDGIATLNGSNANVSVYPNPFSGITHFVLNSNNKSNQIIVQDVMGRTLFAQKNNSNTFNINMEQFNNGVYFYKIETSNRELLTGKLILEHR